MTFEHPHADRELDAIASLGDPRRRALYRHVLDHPDPVTRDHAAAATSLPRAVAAYHLDKLVAAGLLDIRFERQTGRRGPGAGRPAKVYVRPDAAVEVSLPHRDYALMARLLASAVGASPSAATRRAVHDAAHAFGTDLVAHTPSPVHLSDVLARTGYEPYRDDGAVRTRNCPFRKLAQEHRELICGANLALIEGVVDALGVAGQRAVLEPGTDRCCVAVRDEG